MTCRLFATKSLSNPIRFVVGNTPKKWFLVFNEEILIYPRISVFRKNRNAISMFSKINSARKGLFISNRLDSIICNIVPQNFGKGKCLKNMVDYHARHEKYAALWCRFFCGLNSLLMTFQWEVDEDTAQCSAPWRREGLYQGALWMGQVAIVVEDWVYMHTCVCVCVCGGCVEGED